MLGAWHEVQCRDEQSPSTKGWTGTLHETHSRDGQAPGTSRGVAIEFESVEIESQLCVHSCASTTERVLSHLADVWPGLPHLLSTSLHRAQRQEVATVTTEDTPAYSCDY